MTAQNARLLRAAKIAKIQNLLIDRGMADLDTMPLYLWVQAYRPDLIPERPLDFKSHQYLKDIYRDDSQVIYVKKSSQIGLSEWLISLAIHACDQRNATVMYVFPTERNIYDFSSARFGPAIEASPYLKQIVVEGHKQGASRITLKRIRDRFLYLRGGQVGVSGNAPQLKSVDADIIIVDEVDECDSRVIPVVQERLGHSHIAEQRMVSTPTYANYGIDALWRNTDQQEWFIECHHCGTKQNITINHVVLTWDDLERPIIWHGQDENRAYAACEHCGKELNRLHKGEWVARYPDREIRGYHPTKFASPTVDLLQIVENLKTIDETKRRETINQALGETYTPRGGQLTPEILDECRRDYAHGPRFDQNAYMGLDVGKVLSVVIRGEREPDTGEWPQLYAGEVDTFTEAGKLIKQFKVNRAVVDALPETRKARDFQDDFPRVVWLAYYPDSDSKKAESMAWNETERTVLMDRTRTLDETFARFYDAKNTLPANARDIPNYYAQVCAPVRVLETKRNGTTVARYVEGNAADHYAHAENYCRAAMSAPKPPQSTAVSRSVSASDL